MANQYLSTLKSAYGLTTEERAQMRDLVATYERNKTKNDERMDYYEDKSRVSFAGIELRNDFSSEIRTDVGWVGKGVDMLAARSVFDGFTVNDKADEQLDAVLDANDFAAEYSRAVPSQLIHGYGMWSVCRGDEGEPDALIRYYNGDNSAALWDYRHHRVECALVIDGYERKNEGATLEPNFCVLYTDKYVVELSREDGSTAWSIRRLPNNMGRAMVVPMAYRPNIKPLGKSRVSRAAMRITDNMRREIFLMNIQSRKYSLPTKYMTNVSDGLMDNLDKATVYNDEMLVVGKDEDGETVTIGQLQASSPENHIAVMNKLAQEMAAEFGLPASTFGADTSKTYTSSDALRANQDEIILEARQLNRDNAKALCQLAQMVMAIIRNKPMASLAAEDANIEVSWIDPAMPSASQRADALVKQVSMMPWLAETDEILRQLDYDEPTRKRLMRQKDDAQAAQSLAAILMGNVEEPADADTKATAE